MISITEIRRIAALICVAVLLFSSPSHAGFYEAAAAYKRGDYETALRELKPLAEQGNANAQYNLGVMYYLGQSVPQNYAKAMKWYRLAAKQCNAYAQSSLGSMSGLGLGVPQDYTEAEKWFRKAAEQGDADAQTELGVMYARGWGVPQDFVVAHMWFNIAGAQGNERGQTFRDLIAKMMTSTQIAEARRLAREWHKVDRFLKRSRTKAMGCKDEM